MKPIEREGGGVTLQQRDVREKPRREGWGRIGLQTVGSTL